MPTLNDYSGLKYAGSFDPLGNVLHNCGTQRNSRLMLLLDSMLPNDGQAMMCVVPMLNAKQALPIGDCLGTRNWPALQRVLKYVLQCGIHKQAGWAKHFNMLVVRCPSPHLPEKSTCTASCAVGWIRLTPAALLPQPSQGCCVGCALLAALH